MASKQWAIIAILAALVSFLFCSLGFLFFALAPARAPIALSTAAAAQPTLVPTPPAPVATNSSLPTLTPQLPASTLISSPEIVVANHECHVSKSRIFCLVTATNTGRSVTNADFEFNLFDPDGISTGGFYGSGDSLFPGETRKVLVRNSLPQGTTFGRYSLSAKTSDLFVTGSGFSSNPLLASNVTYKPGTFIYDDVTALVTNTTDKTIDGIQLIAILYDKNGAFSGGGDGFIPILPPNGKALGQINVEKFGDVSKVEAYPSFSNITTIK